MSLGAYESSRFSGEPVNLYFFKYGPAAKDFYAYCDGEDVIPFGLDDAGDPISYQPIAIDRGKLTSSGTLDKSNLTITTPHNVGLANLYLMYPPSSVTSLIMFQGHVNDGAHDFKVAWSGTVLSCARKASRAEFTCQPVSTSMRRNGLRRRYQFGCPHALYGPDCRASKVAGTRATTVASLTNSRITLPNGWAGQAYAEKFLQGLVEWIGTNGSREVRTILRIENGGRTLLLSGLTRGLVVGAAVSVILGCNHKSGTDAQPDGDCGPLHDNILNFGGQERIPFNNPIGLVNQFY